MSNFRRSLINSGGNTGKVIIRNDYYLLEYIKGRKDSSQSSKTDYLGFVLPFPGYSDIISKKNINPVSLIDFECVYKIVDGAYNGRIFGAQYWEDKTYYQLQSNAFAYYYGEVKTLNFDPPTNTYGKVTLINSIFTKPNGAKESINSSSRPSYTGLGLCCDRSDQTQANYLGDKTHIRRIKFTRGLIYDFVPVQRISDNVVGFLDLLANKFYPSTGARAFPFTEYSTYDWTNE